MSEVTLYDNLFLSIGAMKAGTTWLHRLFSRHPELCFTPEKEIHFFYHRYVDNTHLNDTHRMQNARSRYLTRYGPDNSSIEQMRSTVRWVSAYLDSPVDDLWFRNLFDMRNRHKYACDFSNLTAHIPGEAWPRIAAQCNKLRVLYTMRDPIKRLWSHVKFHLDMNKQLELLDVWGPQDYENFVRQPHIWDNAEYGAVLRRLRENLPAECYKVIFYEDIHADQMGMLRQLESFLGIREYNYPRDVMDRRFNQGVKVEMPDYFPGLFVDDLARIRQEIEAEGFEIPIAWG